MKQKQPNTSDPSDINIYPLTENVHGMVKVLIQVFTRIQSGKKTLPAWETETMKRVIQNFLSNSSDPFTSYTSILSIIIKDRSKTKNLNTYLKNEISGEKSFLKYKAIAESLLSLEEDKSPENINYWITWFTERNNKAEWIIFQQLIFTNLSILQP